MLVGVTGTMSIDLSLALLRGALGAVMLAHGINHIIGGGRIPGTARWFESLGMRPGRFHAWLASLTELVAGALLVMGLATAIAAGAALGVMLVALTTNHRRNGFFIFRPGEGWEYVMTLSAVSLAVSGLGAGRWSLDSVLDVNVFDGWRGLLIAAVIGFGGACTLLAIFWRPSST